MLHLDLYSDSNAKFIKNIFLNNKIFNKKIIIDNYFNFTSFQLIKIKNENANIILILDFFKNFNEFNKLQQCNLIDESILDQEISDLVSQILGIKNKCDKLFIFLPKYIEGNFSLRLYNILNKDLNYYSEYINFKIKDKLINLNNLFLIQNDFNLIDKQDLLRFHNISFNRKYFENIAKNLITFSNIKKRTIKLIILDLDNTIWFGEVGEIGYKNIGIGKSKAIDITFRNFQLYLKKLRDSGYLLAICSKNDLGNIKEVFSKNKNMVLKITDFVTIRANWKNKFENINSILEELNLSARNTIFVDDSKYERTFVKNKLKNINVFEFPINTLDLVHKFKNYKRIVLDKITETDLNRNDLYVREKKRKDLKVNNSYGWLNQLKIKIKFEENIDFIRVAEMFNRTNQFNNYLNRYDSSELKKILSKGKYYQVSYEDIYGYDGTIGFISLKNKGKNIIIENFLLSCRYFERQIEDVILKFIYLKYKKLNYKDFSIKFKKSNKNIYFFNKMSEKNYLNIDGNTFKINENLKSFKPDYEYSI